MGIIDLSIDKDKVYTGDTFKIMAKLNNSIKTGDGYSVTLADTIQNKMAIKIKGNSTQETTTGKNLYPTGTKFTLSAIEWVDNYGNAISSYAQITANNNYIDLQGNQTYTFKVDSYANINAIQVIYLDGTTIKTFVNTGGDTYAHVFATTTDTRIWVRYRPVATNTETYIIAQLEKGNTATSYEKYTRWYAFTKSRLS